MQFFDNASAAPPMGTKPLQAFILIFFLLAISLSFRPDALLEMHPLVDDGFYALSVSRHLALGNGISVDGDTLTNGFQPLLPLLRTPLYLFTDGARYFTLRLVLLVDVLVYGLTLLVVGRLAREIMASRRPDLAGMTAWVAMFLYAANGLTLRLHFNGLESGAVLLGHALLWWVFLRSPWARGTWALIAYGVLCGLLVLVRIDAVFLVVITTVGITLMVNRQQGPARALRAFMLLGATSFLVSSPWWFYNLVWFDSLLPSSGAAQQTWQWSGGRWIRTLYALGTDLLPWTVTVDALERHAYFWLGLVRVTVFGGLLGLLGWRWRYLGGSSTDGATVGLAWRFAVQLLLAMSILLVWYTLSSWATHFYFRYLSPILLPVVVSMSLLFVVLWDSLALAWQRRILILLLALPTLPVLGLLLYYHSGRYSIGFENQLALVRTHVPTDALVASSQSGTLGYFRDGVVNLDGKVNVEALRYQGRIPAYLEMREIHWLCDWPRLIRRRLGGDPGTMGWEVVASQGAFVLYRHDGRTVGEEGAVGIRP